MQCLQTHSLTQSLNLFLMANDMGSAPSPATARANMKRRVLFIFGYSILSTSLRTSASRFGETRMEVLHDLIFPVSKTHHSCSRTHDIDDKTSFKKKLLPKIHLAWWHLLSLKPSVWWFWTNHFLADGVVFLFFGPFWMLCENVFSLWSWSYWYIFLSCNKAHFGWDMNGIGAVQPQQGANPYGVLVREKYSGPFFLFLLWTEQSIWPSYTIFTNLHFPEIRQFGEASSPSPSSHRSPPILLLQSNGWHRYGSVCVLPGQSLIEVNASQNRTQ